jgi:DNA-binding MarR family transcriptional regulator
MTTKHNLSLSIYQYVRGLYKGTGKSLGEIAAEARIFESDMNTFIDDLEAMEGLIR